MRKRMLKIVVAWLAMVFVLIKVFSPLAHRETHGAFDDDDAPLFEVPYTMQRPSYVRPAAEWLADRMYDARHKVGNRIRTSKKLPASVKKVVPGLGRSKTRNGPPPHAPLAFPSFQAKMYKLTAPNWKEYEQTLSSFARQAFPKQLASWAVSEMRRTRRKRSFTSIPQRIWQTGRVLPYDATTFIDVNPKASYNFYTDPLLEKWAGDHFNGSLIKNVWDGMERIVLKTDFWRYLVTFLEGGFYSGTLVGKICFCIGRGLISFFLSLVLQISIPIACSPCTIGVRLT